MRSRFCCLAICDFFAILPLKTLFLASRPLLALLAVWIDFIDYIDTPSSSDDLIPLGGVCFDRSSNFHRSFRRSKGLLYPYVGINFKLENKEGIGENQGRKKSYPYFGCEL